MIGAVVQLLQTGGDASEAYKSIGFGLVICGGAAGHWAFMKFRRDALLLINKLNQHGAGLHGD